MSEQMLIQHCSPTLAGMKTGNMFTCVYTNLQEVKDFIRSLNRLLRHKGLRVMPLRYTKERVLIYVYRPAYLSRDLQHQLANALLTERGYSCLTPERCILHLMNRLKESEEFPHEIGLFLGYPPEDVHGFIENKPDSCKCTGVWKVYGDAEEAQRIFAKYKKCTDVYSRRWAEGKSLERLAVRSDFTTVTQ